MRKIEVTSSHCLSLGRYVEVGDVLEIGKDVTQFEAQVKVNMDMAKWLPEEPAPVVHNDPGIQSRDPAMPNEHTKPPKGKPGPPAGGKTK